jgi:hypothetical protein
LKSASLEQNHSLQISGETVEKVPNQVLGGDPEKNEFTECATIHDLTLMKGRETPQNQPLTELKGFSTVSEGIFKSNLKPFTANTKLSSQSVAGQSLDKKAQK